MSTQVPSKTIQATLVDAKKWEPGVTHYDELTFSTRMGRTKLTTAARSDASNLEEYGVIRRVDQGFAITALGSEYLFDPSEDIEKEIACVPEGFRTFWRDALEDHQKAKSVPTLVKEASLLAGFLKEDNTWDWNFLKKANAKSFLLRRILHRDSIPQGIANNHARFAFAPDEFGDPDLGISLRFSSDCIDVNPEPIFFRLLANRLDNLKPTYRNVPGCLITFHEELSPAECFQAYHYIADVWRSLNGKAKS